MSIRRNPERKPKMAHKSAFLLNLNSLTDTDREYLWANLFPAMAALKARASVRRNSADT